MQPQSPPLPAPRPRPLSLQIGAQASLLVVSPGLCDVVRAARRDKTVML